MRRQAAICGARLLSVPRQVGAHLWHEGPAGGLSGIRTHNLLTLAGSTTELSPPNGIVIFQLRTKVVCLPIWPDRTLYRV